MRAAIIAMVHAAAAVAFLGFGWRHRSKFLLGVGAVFVAAALLVVPSPAIGFQRGEAYGYTLGFAASIAGLLGLLRRYRFRQNDNSRSDG